MRGHEVRGLCGQAQTEGLNLSRKVYFPAVKSPLPQTPGMNSLCTYFIPLLLFGIQVISYFSFTNIIYFLLFSSPLPFHISLPGDSELRWSHVFICRTYSNTTRKWWWPSHEVQEHWIRPHISVSLVFRMIYFFSSTILNELSWKMSTGIKRH